MERRTLNVCLAALVAAAPAVAAPQNLYEWLAVAPLVVEASVAADDSRFIELEVKSAVRGGLAPGERLHVDLRMANRDREEGTRPLRLEKGKDYLVLVRRNPARHDGEHPLYELVREIEGAREIPAEGGPALVEAAKRLASVQDRKDDLFAWESFRSMLDETNPILIDVALEMFIKFRRGKPEILSSLRPLLDHPSTKLRAHAAQLTGAILERREVADGSEEAAALLDLYARARRDPSVDVRVAATIAVGNVDGRGPLELLREIAEKDPEQAVRYEAERILYERKRDGESPPRR